jgi:hypothetical protein
LYVLASTTIGFAHRFEQLAVPADLAQFTLPDGTLPIICGQGRGGEHDKSGHTPFCGACCLTSAPGLLLPPAVVFSMLVVSAKADWTSYWARAYFPRTVATLRARGPPLA